MAATPKRPTAGLDESDLPVIDLRSPPTVALDEAPGQGGEDQPRRLQKGDIIGGVRLVEEIGSAQKVLCWRAERRNGEPATIHILRADASLRERQTFVEAARKVVEITTLVSLRGVIEVVRVDAEDGLYVTNTDVAGTLADLPVLQWELSDKVAFIGRLCASLGAMHSAGLRHGCLCPTNVLLDADLSPVICDVGVVKLADSFGASPQARHEYAPFAALEVRRGQPPTVRSDVFSFGRLLLYVLTERVPPVSDEELPQLEHTEDLPEGLLRIIRRCTALDPSRRYPIMNEVLEELGTYRKQDSVAAAPAEAGRPERSPGAPAVAAAPAHKSSPPPPAAAAAASEGPPARPSLERLRRVPARSARAKDEPQDPLTPTATLAAGASGGALLLGAAAMAFYAGVNSRAAVAIATIGAVALSLALPAFGRGLLGRIAVAVVFAAAVLVLEPTEHVAQYGRQRMLSRGDSSARAATIQQLQQKGITKFIQLDLRGSDFGGLDLRGLTFDGSKLQQASFVRAKLANASLADANVTGADFSGADLQNTKPEAMIGWTETICNEDTLMPKPWRCENGKPVSARRIGIRGVEQQDGEGGAASD